MCPWWWKWEVKWIEDRKRSRNEDHRIWMITVKWVENGRCVRSWQSTRTLVRMVDILTELLSRIEEIPAAMDRGLIVAQRAEEREVRSRRPHWRSSTSLQRQLMRPQNEMEEQGHQQEEEEEALEIWSSKRANQWDQAPQEESKKLNWLLYFFCRLWEEILPKTLVASSCLLVRIFCRN